MIKHQINEAENGHPGSSENKDMTVLAVVCRERSKRKTDEGLKV